MHCFWGCLNFYGLRCHSKHTEFFNINSQFSISWEIRYQYYICTNIKEFCLKKKKYSRNGNENALLDHEDTYISYKVTGKYARNKVERSFIFFLKPGYYLKLSFQKISVGGSQQRVAAFHKTAEYLKGSPLCAGLSDLNYNLKFNGVAKLSGSNVLYGRSVLIPQYAYISLLSRNAEGINLLL